MEALPSERTRLAEAYEELLFAGPLKDRLSHHLAHVASERWLALELAMLVNDRAEDFGLSGWRAAVELAFVDVTLVSPGADPRGKLPGDAIFLELKLTGTEYWNTVWQEVRVDLAGKKTQKAVKPRANFAVCFVLNPTSSAIHRRLKSTDEKYRRFVASVPHEPAEFEPVAGQPKLLLLRSSTEHRLYWPRPIYPRWLAGYEASLRIVWVTSAPARPPHASTRFAP
jgi:hypothetical protein